MSAEQLHSPSFDENNIPLTLEQLQAREKWMMEDANWRENHSVPSAGEHYRYLWKWDSLKAVVINARREDPDRAATEFVALEQYRDTQTGFLSNKVFASTEKKTWRDYPEAWTFNNNKVGSSYSQPPLNAWAAMETYSSFQRQGRDEEGLEFLESVYGTAEEGKYTGLKGEHAYFINHRQNSIDDPLIAIVHPNETGRDSDEANKPWIANAEKRQSAPYEWLEMQKLGYDLGRLGRDPNNQRIDWIPVQIRSRYWVNDVMFNCMHANNMRYLAGIASLLSKETEDPAKQEQYIQDIQYYQEVADRVETEILDRMWDEEHGFFYNLDQHGNQIPVDSITGLFPLMLENIPATQTSALLDKLEHPEWFASPYPIPTHAIRSKFYNPDPGWFAETFTPLWSGPVWISPNHLLVEEGLVPRAIAHAEQGDDEHRITERALAIGGLVAQKTIELLAINPKSREYYSANTGEGKRVSDFMWSNIGLHFEKYQSARTKLQHFVIAKTLE